MFLAFPISFISPSVDLSQKQNFDKIIFGDVKRRDYLYIINTKLHSSRMRTAPGGVSVQGGVPARGGCKL